MKICSTLLVIKNVNKTTMAHHYTSPRMTKIKSTDNTLLVKCWLEYGAIKLLTLLKVMQNSTVTLENNLIVS